MSIVSGKASLSNLKHGIGGGYSPPNSRTKQTTAIEANSAAEEAKEARPKPKMFKTLKEAMEALCR